MKNKDNICVKSKAILPIKISHTDRYCNGITCIGKSGCTGEKEYTVEMCRFLNTVKDNCVLFDRPLTFLEGNVSRCPQCKKAFK